MKKEVEQKSEKKKEVEQREERSGAKKKTQQLSKEKNPAIKTQSIAFECGKNGTTIDNLKHHIMFQNWKGRTNKNLITGYPDSCWNSRNLCARTTDELRTEGKAIQGSY